MPEQADVFLDSVRLVGHRLVLLSHRHAASQVEIWSLEGKLELSLELPGQGSVEQVSGRAGDRDGYLSYQTFTQPETLERFSPSRAALAPWQAPPQAPAAMAQARVAGGFGTGPGRHPGVHVRDQPRARPDARAPFVLEGYGGFATPVLPRYWPATAALLEAGFGVAWPSLRGGGEYGGGTRPACWRGSRTPSTTSSPRPAP